MNRRRDERGAVAVFLGITVSLLVLVAAFAVDLGMQRVVRRDMQALADVVALDLARELDGKRTQAELATVIDPTSPTSALSLSVARNSTTLGETPSVTAELGAWDGTVFNQAVDPPTAVRVTASGKVAFAFRPGEGGATRTAIGSTIKSACFSMGSFAARFRSGDSALISTLLSPMNELLRPQANIDAVSYTGLANAFVTLDELAVAAGLGSTDQLLTSTITAGELIEAAITVLQAGGAPNSVAIAALDQLLKGQANLATPVLLTEVLNVSPSDTAALQTDLSVLDLVAGTILVADGTTGFKLGNGNLGTKIAGVASLTTAELSITQGVQTACGPYGSPQATAESSQISGAVQAKLELPTINLGGGDIVQTEPSIVSLNVSLGTAQGRLGAEPECHAGTTLDPDKTTVDVTTALATLAFSTTLGFKTTLSIPLLGNVTVTWDQAATAGQPMPSRNETAVLLTPPNDTTPYEAGTGDAGLGGATVVTVATNVEATVKLLGVDVPVPAGDVLNLVMPVLQPIINLLAVNPIVDGRLDTLAASIDTFLSPFLTLLGLNVSGADLYTVGRPICGAPVLRG
ncbi:MAG: hypothetical protein WCS84_00420 [Nocardioides sp.]